MRIIFYSSLLLSLILFGNFSLAQNTLTAPGITISSDEKSIFLTRTHILTNYQLHKISLGDTPTYPSTKISYNAVRLCDLLDNFKVQDNALIQVIGQDKFSSYIPAKLVSHCDIQSNISYLAIEPNDHKWPLLGRGSVGTAGPFAIIWDKIGKPSPITAEYWAWKVSDIVIHKKGDSKKLFIERPNSSDKATLAGYQLYIKNCSGCHSINLIGQADIGPDLNLPLNPTEYLKDGILKKLIRDPQSVRYMKNDRMVGLLPSSISDQEIDDLIKFLRYMSTQKPK